MSNEEKFAELEEGIQDLLLEIEDMYSESDLQELAYDNCIDKLQDAHESKQEADELIRDLEAEIEELEVSAMFLDIKNLYDVQKAEIIKYIFDNCTLIQLQEIKQKLIKQ